MFPRHDFHVHTNYSDGVSSPARIVEAATKKGLKAVAITDHGPELSVGIRQGRIEHMIEDVKIVKADAEIPVFLGMEVNVVDLNGNIDVGGEVLDRLDVVLAGVHYLRSSETLSEMVARDYFETVVNVMERQELDILAHPFWYHEDLSSYLSKRDLESFAKVAAEQEVAIELSGKYRVPPKELLSLCDEKGVKFSFGTDAHAPEELGEVGWAVNMLKEVGASRESLLVEELV